MRYARAVTKTNRNIVTVHTISKMPELDGVLESPGLAFMRPIVIDVIACANAVNFRPSPASQFSEHISQLRACDKLKQNEQWLSSWAEGAFDSRESHQNRSLAAEATELRGAAWTGLDGALVPMVVSNVTNGTAKAAIYHTAIEADLTSSEHPLVVSARSPLPQTLLANSQTLRPFPLIVEPRSRGLRPVLMYMAPMSTNSCAMCETSVSLMTLSFP